MTVTHKHTLIFSPNDEFAKEQAEVTEASMWWAKMKKTETTTSIALEWIEVVECRKGEE